MVLGLPRPSLCVNCTGPYKGRYIDGSGDHLDGNFAILEDGSNDSKVTVVMT